MGDVFEYLDEVPLKYPANFEANITSKKWKERFDVLEELLEHVKKNPKLDSKGDYGSLISHLKAIIDRDANINVQANAIRMVGALGAGLRSRFVPYVSPLSPFLFDKFKEKKPVIRDPLIECCDSLANIVNLDNIADEVTTAMGKPNPQIKQQMDNFIFRQLLRYGRNDHPKKFVKSVLPVLVKHAEDGDKDVRESALLALGGVMRLTGESILQNLAGAIINDSLKSSKITEGKEKSEEEYVALQAKLQQAAPVTVATSEEAVSDSVNPESSKDEAEPDPWEFMDPVNVLKKLPANFEESLNSTKWLERKEALENLLKLMTENPKLDPQVPYNDISKKIAGIISKDSNINVIAVAAKVVAKLAKGLRTNFSPYSSIFVPVVLEKFKEKKSLVKDSLVEAIDEIYKTTTLESMSDEIGAALGKPNPNIKAQTNLFLSRVFRGLNSQTMSKKALKEVVPLIVKSTGDSDSETREAAFSAIGSLMKAVGKNVVTAILGDIVNDKTKMNQIEKFYEEAVQKSGDELVSEMVKLKAKTETKENNFNQSSGVREKPILSRREAPKTAPKVSTSRPAEKPRIMNGTQSSSMSKDVNKNFEKKTINPSPNIRPSSAARPLSAARPPSATRPPSSTQQGARSSVVSDTPKRNLSASQPANPVIGSDVERERPAFCSTTF
ncbi:hypothetical protein FO519_003354 [Halicephalobus sp. NKZ332]|nr:hypothetical protein FO519_003354 [Halicephalobus sp. NKZ332]